MGVNHPDISKAQTLPSNYYTDEKLYLQLLEKFPRSWNFIGLEKNFVDIFNIGAKPFLLVEFYKLLILTILSSQILKLRKFI